MSYSSQAQLSQDGSFINRVAACAATQPEVIGNPVQWAYDHVWNVAASPGFADAYESALAAEVTNPGDDPSVISDAQILAAVQAEIGGAT